MRAIVRLKNDVVFTKPNVHPFYAQLTLLKGSLCIINCDGRDIRPFETTLARQNWRARVSKFNYTKMSPLELLALQAED